MDSSTPPGDLRVVAAPSRAARGHLGAVAGTQPSIIWEPRGVGGTSWALWASDHSPGSTGHTMDGQPISMDNTHPTPPYRRLGYRHPAIHHAVVRMACASIARQLHPVDQSSHPRPAVMGQPYPALSHHPRRLDPTAILPRSPLWVRTGRPCIASPGQAGRKVENLADGALRVREPGCPPNARAPFHRCWEMEAGKWQVASGRRSRRVNSSAQWQASQASMAPRDLHKSSEGWRRPTEPAP